MFSSEDRQILLKDCDRLVKMETTREEIMDDAETVDSTTDCEPSPVKKPKIPSTRKAMMEAARGRAKALFSSCKFDFPTCYCM